jgi:hypothetical protein
VVAVVNKARASGDRFSRDRDWTKYERAHGWKHRYSPARVDAVLQRRAKTNDCSRQRERHDEANMPAVDR